MNSLLWGNKPAFAIEAESEQAQAQRRFGHMAFWIDGQRLGDPDDTVDFATSAHWVRVFLRESGRRTRPDLEQLTSAACFHELVEKYLKPGSPVPWDRDPYVLDEVGDASIRDWASAVAFRRTDGVDRVIARNLTDGSFFETELASGVLDEILRKYCQWAESL